MSEDSKFAPTPDLPEILVRPNLIEVSVNRGYLGRALATLQEHGHSEFEEKIRQTEIDGQSSLTDEEVKIIEEVLEPKHQFSSFMTGYAEARWGGSASAVQRGKDGKYYPENIAAKFWWRLTPEERNNFYLRMTREGAENFWNSTKLDEGEAPVEIKVREKPARTA